MLKSYKDILLEWEEKDKRTIEKLHSMGFEWGEGYEEQNPEDARSGVNIVHTNRTCFWIKWRGAWKICNKLNAVKILCLFDICKTPEDIDAMLEIL